MSNKQIKKRYNKMNSAYGVNIISHGPIDQNAMYFEPCGLKPKELWKVWV